MTTATTSGVWKSINKRLPRRKGINTSQVSWGVAADRSRRQSGYRFVGSTTPIPLDGQEFVLGTFTHNNFVIRSFRNLRFVAKLQVTVAFDEGGLRRDFNFEFHHNETPNRGRGVPDEVLLSTARAAETVVLGGATYAVEIVGFKQNGEVVKKFISAENRANSAVIVARLVLIEAAPAPAPAPAPKPEPETEDPEDPEETTTYTFNVLNPDGTVFGLGCFTYLGDETPVDIAHVISGGGRGPELTSFWYEDPIVGTMDIHQLLAMSFVRESEGKPSRFTVNMSNVPDDTHALAGGTAAPGQHGSVSTHRGGDQEQSCGGRKLTFPTPCRCVVGDAPAEPELEIPLVDLVVVIDSSVSMRPDALILSDAVSAAIDSAKASCPSDLRVIYLGIEGRFSKTLFDTTIRQYLVGLGVAEADMRGRKRGSVASGGAQEDGARAIEDISTHFDWREDASRAMFFLGDEGLEGGDTREGADLGAATQAIDVANTANVRIHTYLADSRAKAAVRQSNKDEFQRVASSTGGQSFTAADTLDSGFQAMLETVICASKAEPVEPDTEPCPCTKKVVASAQMKPE